ncbi:MAG TPA: class I SAM-dependent RNA methyltransferase [Balneolales bacterium]|nr:class I SAM-dependent RNA methyltransferase [Balneolales bacterium]
MIARTLFGLEQVLADELRALGAEEIQILNRAVQFSGDMALMYEANLCLRSALSILCPLVTFKATNEDMLYLKIRKINWKQFLNEDNTLAIDSSVHSSYFTHSHYVALRAKDAIVDQFREKTGVRPSVDTENPDLRLNLHISDDTVTLSLDSSGDSLHRRGYRKVTNIAPINEVLAAGLVLLSDWDGRSPFIDPMCGSGTIAIEAALYALNIPPGSLRKKFGFMSWKTFNRELWNAVKNKALSRIKTSDFEFLAADISGKSLNIAKENIDAAGLADKIILIKKPFQKLTPPRGKGGIIIMNPPYGERMQKKEINDFYKSIGDQLKSNYPGYTAWILSANQQALKHVGLRTSKKITLYNGPLECRFQKYELYEGSKKHKHKE